MHIRSWGSVPVSCKIIGCTPHCFSTASSKVRNCTLFFVLLTSQGCLGRFGERSCVWSEIGLLGCHRCWELAAASVAFVCVEVQDSRNIVGCQGLTDVFEWLTGLTICCEPGNSRWWFRTWLYWRGLKSAGLNFANLRALISLVIIFARVILPR